MDANNKPKPRLLLVGHSYSVAVNRQKAAELSEYFEVDVSTLDITKWWALGRRVQDLDDPSHEGKYGLTRHPHFPRWYKHTKIILFGLGRKIRQTKPDVILVENEPWSLIRWQARIMSWLFAPRAHFHEFTWENVPRPGFKGKVTRLLYRLAAISGQYAICGNCSARKLMTDAGFPKSHTLIAAQFGINPSTHTMASESAKASWRADLGWPQDSIVIGYCGRLVQQKGITDLITATELLRTTNTKLHLILMGTGALESELKSMTETRAWLKIKKAVPHSEVPEFVNKLDIFVLPSKPYQSTNGQVWEEQFGHVLIEAMGCGTLTIGSSSGAIPEVINDEELIFQHSNQEHLAEVVGKWVANDEMRVLKAKQQHRLCHEKWTHKAVARQYADYIMEKLQQHQVSVH